MQENQVIEKECSKKGGVRCKCNLILSMSKWYPRLFTFASPSLISIYKTAERIINSSLVTTCILNTYLSLLTFQALLHSRQCREHWSSEMLLMFGRKLCIPFSLTLASLLLSSAKIIIYYRSQNHINHQHTPWSSVLTTTGPERLGLSTIKIHFYIVHSIFSQFVTLLYSEVKFLLYLILTQ